MMKRLRQIFSRARRFVWVMALVFAFAPGISFANGSAIGAFSSALVHSHADGEHGHSHHGHHHHHEKAEHHEHEDMDRNGEPGQAHVHYDAACPSLLVPGALFPVAQIAPASPVAALAQDDMDGSSPGNLLRPPIRL